MPANDSLLRTAQYTEGPEENGAKNTGEKGSSAVRTAQDTHSGRLKRRTRTLPKPFTKLFRRNRALEMHKATAESHPSGGGAMTSHTDGG